METLLSVNSLTKKYGSLTAVKNLSFEVMKGTVFGMLGPNGSGKTTTLGMILGVTHSTSGSFSWFGQPLSKDSLKRIGAILETPNFYPYLSAEKNLFIAADIKGVPRKASEGVLRMVDLYERRKDSFKTYSLGMKQRLAIASALLSNPEVLILDEPTNGLDPQGIADVRELIGNIAATGTTIILASHLLDEVEKVCSDVVILRSGESLFCGAVADFLREDDTFELAAQNMELLAQALEEFPQMKSFYREGNKILLTTSSKTDGSVINEYLLKRGIVLSHFLLKRKSLEKHFLDLVKNHHAQTH